MITSNYYLAKNNFPHYAYKSNFVNLIHELDKFLHSLSLARSIFTLQRRLLDRVL